MKKIIILILSGLMLLGILSVGFYLNQREQIRHVSLLLQEIDTILVSEMDNREKFLELKSLGRNNQEFMGTLDNTTRAQLTNAFTDAFLEVENGEPDPKGMNTH